MRYGRTVKKQTLAKSKLDSHPVFDGDRGEKPNARVLCVGDTESHQGLPYDLPARLVVHRLLSKFDKTESDSKRPTGLKGWVIEHEIFRRLNQKEKTFEVAMKIHVKIIRDGRVAVFVDDEKVFEANALETESSDDQ